MYLNDQKMEELIGNRICRNLRKRIKGESPYGMQLKRRFPTSKDEQGG